MNKVIYINFGGRLIPIEEVAQESLELYLSRLKNSFAQESDADEILIDMQYRISELFDQILKSGKHCIEQKDIDAIIGIMGTHEAIQENITDEGQTSFENTTAPEEPKQETPKQEQPKKLCANNNDKIIGGVCGGIASYLNIDPAIVRILFALITLAWGTGIIIYIILWIILPKSNDQPIQFKKRLYRNPDKKKISGVCSGLAAYFKIDTVIVRGIFLAPIIISLLSWNVFGWLSVPFSWGAFPTMIVIYILMTIAIPEAKTVTEKMAMNGEKIDFENIRAAYDNTTTQANEFLKDNKNVFARIITIIVKIIVGFFIGIGLFALATLIIGILTALLFNDNNMYDALAFYDIITQNETYSIISKIAFAIILLVPFIALLRAIRNLITGKKKKTTSNKVFNSVLSLSFIASVIALIYILNQTSRKYKSEGTVDVNYTIQTLPQDTLFIYPMNKVGDYEYFQSNIFINENKDSIKTLNGIQIIESTDNQIHIRATKAAKGPSKSKAKLNAEAIGSPYQYANNNLFLPEFSEYKWGLGANNFKFQNLKYTIAIPKGMPYKFVDFDDEYTKRRNTAYSFRIKTIGFSSKKTTWE